MARSGELSRSGVVAGEGGVDAVAGSFHGGGNCHQGKLSWGVVREGIVQGDLSCSRVLGFASRCKCIIFELKIRIASFFPHRTTYKFIDSASYDQK